MSIESECNQQVLFSAPSGAVASVFCRRHSVAPPTTDHPSVTAAAPPQEQRVLVMTASVASDPYRRAAAPFACTSCVRARRSGVSHLAARRRTTGRDGAAVHSQSPAGWLRTRPPLTSLRRQQQGCPAAVANTLPGAACTALGSGREKTRAAQRAPAVVGGHAWPAMQERACCQTVNAVGCGVLASVGVERSRAAARGCMRLRRLAVCMGAAAGGGWGWRVQPSGWCMTGGLW